MRGIDQIRPRVYDRVRKIYLVVIRSIVQLQPPVEHAYDVVRALLTQRLHGGHGLVRFPVGAHIVARSVYAELKAVLRRDDLRLPLRAVGQPGGGQRLQCALQSGLTEVEAVVVCRRHEVHAALDHYVRVGRRRAEVEHLPGSELLVGQRAFKVRKRVFVVLEVLHGIRERIGVIIPDDLWQTDVAVFKLYA